jgi:lysine-specific demethylase 8
MRPAEFNRSHYQCNQPLQIKDSIAGWRANQWTAEYLEATVGGHRVDVFCNEHGVFDYNQNVATGPVRRQSMALAEAADLIFSEEGNRYYIQQLDLHEQCTQLLRDIARPSLLDSWKVIDRTNLWFGGRGCKTPLHFDDAHNFLIQVKGEKRVWLFPDDEYDNLYPATDQLLPHCSRIDVFAPDHAAFPQYRAAEARRIELVLEPGDTLYIPRRWWHAVESLSPSLSVNFWWRGINELAAGQRTGARRGAP